MFPEKAWRTVKKIWDPPKENKTFKCITSLIVQDRRESSFHGKSSRKNASGPFRPILAAHTNNNRNDVWRIIKFVVKKGVPAWKKAIYYWRKRTLQVSRRCKLQKATMLHSVPHVGDLNPDKPLNGLCWRLGGSVPDIENVEGPTQHVNFLFHIDGASTLVISQGDGRLHNSQEIGEYKIIKDIHDMGIIQLVHTVYI